MQLGQITPVSRSGNLPVRSVSAPEKAAIIVRFLMNEGAEVPLDELPEDLQAELAQQMGSLRRIDRDTLVEVVEEFATELEMTGLTFPKGVAGALSALDGKLSPQAIARIRKRSGVRADADPWEKLREMETDDLLDLLDDESTEVAAVLLSKLDVRKAAEMLGKMPGEKARRVTYAVSKTTSVTPDAVARIGYALVEKVEEIPVLAFDNPAEARVGAILNSSKSATRDDVLEGLDEQDVEFATGVRKEIFTFKHIAVRVDPRDAGAILRSVDNDTLVTAMAAAIQSGNEELNASVEHILNNISGRMADQLRDSANEMDTVKEDDGEGAMSDVVTGVRGLAESGEILLLEQDETKEEAA